jgi:hypothetical protein
MSLCIDTQAPCVFIDTHYMFLSVNKHTDQSIALLSSAIVLTDARPGTGLALVPLKVVCKLGAVS